VKNILITSVGRRVELVQFFQLESKKLSKGTKIYCTDQNPKLSSACQIADSYFEVPNVNHPDYINILRKICVENFIAIVVPTIDTELLLLSLHKDDFLIHGVNIIVSDTSLIQTCRNKNYTNNLLNKIGIETPIIYEKDEIIYPCFVKPYDGSSSLGVFILQNKSQLTKSVLENPKNMYMELIPTSFDEFTIDVYYDKYGVLKCLVPRLRIETRAGEVSKGLTSKGIVYYYLKDKLINLKGARGVITLQIFVNKKNKTFRAIEINPRFGGGYPLSHAAGANYPAMLIKEYILGEEIDYLSNWEENLLMLRYDSKVLIHDYKS
jgi:carbamoyl-phosphate synthase large subunit